MGVVRGLASITGDLDAVEARREKSDQPKATWFKIADKQSVKVAFLQELDENSAGYSEKNDLGVLAIEHVAPHDWSIKALCTIGDDECYGCEQHKADYTAGWKQKRKLYINVLVDNGKDEPYVAILSQGYSGKSITPTLLEYATDNGTITDVWFKIKRQGEKTDTSYTILPTKEESPNVEDYEVFDLSNAFRDIPYAEQEAFYNRGNAGSAAVESKPAVNDDTDTW